MNGNTRSAGIWLGAWLLALVLLGLAVAQLFRMSSDLRLFLPQPATREQKLVLDGIGEGPASRMLLIALGGADAEALADDSQKLAEALRRSASFRRVENGSALALPEQVTEYRYLLSPAMDRRHLDAATLRLALQERLQDLTSPAAPLLEPMVASDPTLETLSIAESWAPPRTPRIIDGVWFDAAGKRALLVAETRAAGFDPDGQQRALEDLESSLAAIRGGAGIEMTVSGPGRFSALMKQRTQREATWLGSAATAGLLLLLVLAYRRTRTLLLASLPLASAGLAGLACVSLLYGDVHGITLAFGFTLIGVAQDYPIHLFSHQRRGLDPVANARSLWPALSTGVASTCVAYLAFMASGVVGLAQLAWFTISGLAVAGLTTRYVLPRITGEDFRDVASSARLDRIEARLTLPTLSPTRYAIAAAACLGAIAAMPGAVWQDNLGALTPIPRALLVRDSELRRELGAPDVRYLAAVSASTSEAALQGLEDANAGLENLVADGAIAGFEHAARYLPSARTQMRRQSSLPAAAELVAALDAAQHGLPFKADAFAPFLADVGRSRDLRPLDLDSLRGMPEASLIAGMLYRSDDGYVALITFAGVASPQQLAKWAAKRGPDVTLIDLKQESASLVIRQRHRILWCLLAASLLLVAVVRISLGSWPRVARVLAPMALSTLAIVAVLRAVGTSLDLFHLISLVLAAGLGLDYALYFEHAGESRPDRLRALHGILVCALSTLMVFALLSFSSLPVLRSIGVTVTLGVIFNFLLAASLPRDAESHAP